MSNENELEDLFGYAPLDEVQMREKIANLNKEILKIQIDKKALLGGINSTLKDLNKQLKTAVEFLEQKETATKVAKLSEQATKLLEKAANNE